MEKVLRIQKMSDPDIEDQDLEYWFNKTSEQRLDALQILREQYITLYNKHKEYDESREALRRVYRIIKQA